MGTIITLASIALVIYIGVRFFRDFNTTSQNPFPLTYRTFVEKINQRFFNNTAKLKMINEMEYDLVPPEDSVFVVYIKIKYLGSSMRILVINDPIFFLPNSGDSIEMSYTIKPLSSITQSYEMQIKMAEEFITAYKNHVQNSNKNKN